VTEAVRHRVNVAILEHYWADPDLPFDSCADPDPSGTLFSKRVFFMLNLSFTSVAFRGPTMHKQLFALLKPDHITVFLYHYFDVVTWYLYLYD
jgi:hypothetical protein